jgi:hypothetical protein
MVAVIAATAAGTVTVVEDAMAAITGTDVATGTAADVAMTATATVAEAGTATGLTSVIARGGRAGVEAEARDHPPAEGAVIPVAVAIAETDSLVFAISLVDVT